MNHPIVTTATLAFAGLVCLVAGCASRAPSSAENWFVDDAAVVVVPAEPVGARVAVVNVDHQFVVLDYGGRPVPALGSTVTVYRDTDVAVAELRLTEPRQGRLISADILDGQPQIGDVAR